jgi:hypothetical protein
MSIDELLIAAVIAQDGTCCSPLLNVCKQSQARGSCRRLQSAGPLARYH